MTGSLPPGGPVDEPSPPERFDPTRILETLDRHGVRYVLIGGLAATLHGSPSVTYDLDLAPEQTRDNLERLAAALTELRALRYTDPGKPHTTPTADDFEYPIEFFASPIGYLDVFREAQAVGGYERLTVRAERMKVAGVDILVAALDDIIASKEAANRPKDAAQLPLLYTLRQELGGRDDRAREGDETS
jgi:hypothetical protein